MLTETSANLTAINIFHQNVCGISNKRQELEVYLQSLEIKVDYLCISEHFLNDKSVISFSLENYNLISWNTRSKKARGGSLILAHVDRKAENIDVINKLYKRDSFEICCIRDVDTGLYVCCCYRSPYDRNFDLFMTCMENMLEHLFNRNCIICGDFNVDLLSDSRKRTEFVSLLTCYNFRHLVNDATFIRNGSSSCIDHIITNLPDFYIEKCEVDHNGLADGHGGIFGNFRLENLAGKANNNNQHIVINKRAFSSKNGMFFKQGILKHKWSSMGINAFIKTFSDVFKNAYKKRERILNVIKSTKMKWITNGIRTSSKMKRFLCTNSGNHLDISIQSYKNKYIRIYRRVITKAKKITIRNKINDSTNGSKEIWQIVNNCTNRTKVRHTERLLLKIDGKIIDLGNSLHIRAAF